SSCWPTPKPCRSRGSGRPATGPGRRRSPPDPQKKGAYPVSKLNWKRFALYALIAAAAVLLIVYIRVPIDLARLALRAATPLLLGCVLAYVLNLLLVRYESVWFPHSRARFVVRTRRAVCVLLSVITLLLILVAVVLLVLP